MPIDSIKEIAFQSLLTGKEKAKLDEEKLKKVCTDFESIFIQQILKPMRETVLRSDLFGNGPEKDILESLLDQELSRKLGHRGMGLGKMLYQQLTKQGRAILPEREVPEAGEGGKTSLIR